MPTLTQSVPHHYAELGSGPAILLLHDGTSDADLLTAQHQHLAGCGHRVIVTNPQRSCGVATAPQALLNLLNYLGLGRVLVITLGDAAAGRALQQLAPERVVAVRNADTTHDLATGLQQALAAASRCAQVRRTPLQRLNRRLSGLLGALLPPDDCADEPLREGR